MCGAVRPSVGLRAVLRGGNLARVQILRDTTVMPPTKDFSRPETILCFGSPYGRARYVTSGRRPPFSFDKDFSLATFGSGVSACGLEREFLGSCFAPGRHFLWAPSAHPIMLL
jgi:hypothetical protein